MKTQTILVALCILTGFAATTNQANAAAYQINDTTAVFFTQFNIDASYGSFEIPIMADHTVSYFDRVDVLGYELITEAQETAVVTNVADIVLSSTPINDLRYKMATGTTATFTLMSIVTFAEPINSDITTTITKLPFWVDGRRTSVHENQLRELASVTLAQ
ncbi:MAG: hypothetical protein ACI9SY_000745 [Candidatus Paceibacteria bacterium]|jgi:hypothetical protein